LLEEGLGVLLLRLWKGASASPPTTAQLVIVNLKNLGGSAL
jgi:hypothetical protein